MMRLAISFTLLMGLLSIGVAQAQTKAVGDWQVQPVRLGTAKEFTGCIGVHRTNGPVVFGLSYDIDDEWYATVHSIGPNRWPNAKVIDVSWRFDQQPRRQETANVSQGSLIFELGGNAEVSKELQGARFVEMTIDAEAFRIDLPLLEVAVREMRNCVTAGKAGGNVATPADQQKPGTFDGRTYVGKWAMELYREGGGRFKSCSMSHAVGNGIVHAFHLSDGGNWTMTAFDNSANKAVGRKFKFSYSVDGRPARTGAAEQLADNLTLFDIDNDDAAIGELRAGRQLLVSVDNQQLQFSLDGVGPAIAAVENCFKASTGVAAPSQPVAPPRPPVAPLPRETPSSQR